MTGSEHVEIVYSGEDESEVWVIPGDELGLLDLPSVRELLPPELADAECVGFRPRWPDKKNGCWILRKGKRGLT